MARSPMKLALMVATLLFVSGALAADMHGHSDGNHTDVMNPLCPNKLDSEKARYKCYSKVIRNLVMAVTKVNFQDLFASSKVFEPWMTRDIQGRGAPGKFYGIELNAEYLAVAWPAFVGPNRTNQDPDLNYFVSTGNVVSFQVNYLIYDIPLDKEANWTITGWAKFTPDTNLMSHYDIDFRFYPAFLTEMQLINIPEEQDQMQRMGLAMQVCETTMALCTGELQQYEDYDSCVQYISARPFISEYMAIEADCLLCRVIHSILMVFDVNVHCWHVGPSGPKNGACSKFPYEDEFTFFRGDLWIGKKKWMR